jgi:hypothetical protein
MGVAHDGAPRGYLAGAKGAFSEEFLARKCSCSVQDLHDAIEELKSFGRLEVSEDGVLRVPRMAREGEVSSIRSDAGKQGGRPPKANPKQNPKQNENKQESKQESKNLSKPLVSDSGSDSLVNTENTENLEQAENARAPRTLAEQKAWLDERGWSGIRKASPELVQEISDLKVPDMEESDDMKSLFWIQGRIWWFEEFWADYWLKKSRHDALVAYFEKVTTLETHDRIIAAVQKQAPEMLRREPKNRPHGATWINGFRWNDEAEEPEEELGGLFKGVA